ncbi:type VI secretion system baseplate subunit TssG [Janthinobacterium sp. GW460P]|uniref:type VI secretion system baseplate subunit TssG n=2 Tax=unclassified Janthinobacterium TaxID=2610881 RepID=UPI000A31F9AE|nr:MULTISPECIES: type VI secretion system baseplate subunit TssG [unclassified Janthinobacterium]MCC7704064.1 type VI secretion system baseplate subunit TssG [Janthinobacterium sp. GW460P]MCC7709571.1 type VI secretion system baseplate subunit TssG [Janthinobacterium sp. GW460W]
MQTKKRIAESGVMHHLLAEPYRYQFVQAVRILLSWLHRQNISHTQAFSQVLRFKNSLSMSFPASEIERLTLDDNEQVTLIPAFMRFLGVAGTLPLHHSERIAAYRLSSKDAGVSAFLDIFSHRMLTLYYQAWEKYRLESTLQTQARDAQLPLLMALAGVQRDALPSSAEPDAVTQDAAAWYAGLLRCRPVSAQAIGPALAEYCGVPVALQQFVGSWDYLEKNRRSLLGGVNFVLARGATLGLRLWRHDRRVCLHIGPLDPAGLQRFLPRSAGAAALAKMLALFGVPDLQYEVRLILSPPCITPLLLSANPAERRRLGWTTFLQTAQGKVRGAEVRYLLQLA